jgi:hypothetical protein
MIIVLYILIFTFLDSRQEDKRNVYICTYVCMYSYVYVWQQELPLFNMLLVSSRRRIIAYFKILLRHFPGRHEGDHETFPSEQLVLELCTFRN